MDDKEVLKRVNELARSAIEHSLDFDPEGMIEAVKNIADMTDMYSDELSNEPSSLDSYGKNKSLGDYP